MRKTYLETPEEVIDALQAGKEIRDDEGSIWKLYNGCIIREDKFGFWSANAVISSDFEGLYVDKPEPLKIEVGKWYETRNHKKARCYLIEESHCFFTIDDYTSFSTNKKGYYMEEEAHDLDIIGPWKEDKK